MNRCFRLASSKCFPFQLAATLSLRRLRALLAVAAVFAFCPAAMAQSAHYGGVTSSFTFISPSWLPLGVAVDSRGDLFIADGQLGEIYEVQAVNGVLPASPTSVAIATGFNQPYGLAFDGSGNLFIADAGHGAIKEIVATGGVIAPNSSPQTVYSNAASWPLSIVVDSNGNVYFTDQNAPSTVYEIVASNGQISTSSTVQPLAQGNFTFAWGIAIDAQGDLFVTDHSNNTVTEIVAIGGSVSSNSGLQSVATSGLFGPASVVLDAAGNLYVSENGGEYNPANPRLNSNILEIAAGSWTNPSGPTMKILQGGLWNPLYLAFGLHGELYVADTNDYAIKTIAITPPDFGSVGVGSTSATVQVPFTFDSDTTLGGTAVFTDGATGEDYAVAGANSCQAGSYSAGQSCLIGVQFSPLYPGLRLGSAQLLDTNGNILASVPLHGIGTAPQLVFLPAQPAPNGLPLNGGSAPWGVAVDANKNVYFADLNNSAIGVLSGSTQQETLFSYTNYFTTPQGIALDGAGNLFVADSGSGSVSEIQAGNNGQIYANSNIVSIGSGFSSPMGIAIDGLGDVFVADAGNNAVYEVVADSTGHVTSNSATLTIATGFNSPAGLAIDASGNLYLADTGNGAVKEIVAVNGHVSSTSQVITVSTDFPSPTGVAVDAAGNMYVSDGTGIINVFLTGGVNLSAGSMFLTLDRGLSSPTGVAVSANGDVYFADQGTGSVQQLALSTPPSELDFITPTAVGTVDTADGAQSLTLVNNGNSTLNFPLPLPGAPSSFTLSGNFLWSGATGCSPYGALTLASGFPCTMIIDFEPTVSGPNPGSVSFRSNSLNAASPNYVPVSIALNGTGSTQPILSVGALLSIGYVQAGVTTPTLVAVENIGGAPLTIASIARASGASDFSIGTGGTCPIGSAIAANTGCALEIDYSPAAGFTGTESAVFTITSDGGTKSFTISAYSVLSLTNPVIVLSATTLDFGARTIGAEAWKWDQGVPLTQLTLTLTNAGAGPLQFSDLTTTTGVEDFYWQFENGQGSGSTCISSQHYGTSGLTTGQSCTIQYAFLPWLNGARQGNLHIGSNAVSGNLNVTLKGIGVLPAGVLAVIPQQGASSRGGGKLATIDPALHKVFAVSGGHLTEIDTNTLAYNSLSMSGGVVGPTQLALNAATGTIYGESQNGFYAINEAAGTASFTPVQFEYFYDIAVNPVTNKTYLTDYGSHIGIVDGAASNAYLSINTSGANYLFSTTSLAVDTTRNLTYVLDNYVGKIAVVSGSALSTNITGLPTQGSLLTFNPFSNKLYTNGSNSTPLTVIDGATHAVSSIAGIHATAVTVNPMTNRVYATNYPAVWSGWNQTATIAVIDGATQAILANVPVGQASAGAEAIAIDTVSNEIYVSNGYSGGVSNSVSVIDGATNTVSATVATDYDPGAIVVDEANHHAFVLNERLLPQGYPTGSIFVIASPKDDGPTLAPAIAAAFGATTIAVNATTSLNFTITNPNNSYTLSSVGFQAQLPGGLQIAAGTTAACGGSLTITSNGTITLAGALVAPGSPCVVSMTVTGTAVGNDSVTTTPVSAWPSLTGNTASAAIAITLTTSKTTPTITWATPAAITYGTALSATQLNATASMQGTFAYLPVSGTVLGAGANQTLSVTFSPTDTADYTTATATVALTVNKATPSITWATPDAITYGTALSAAQLNASTTVAGSFAYTPASVTVLNAGSQTLSATFTPTDTTNYTTATKTVTLVVNQVTPTITWSTPAAINYGTALGATQLNASTTVAGSFAYTPVSGTVLAVGSQPLSVTFTPTDITNYTTATKTVTLVVNQASQAITFNPPTSPVIYGVGPVTLTASGGASGNPVGFTVMSGPGSISGTFLTITGVGSVTVKANQAGNANYTAAPSVSQTLIVNPATLTVTANNISQVVGTASPAYSAIYRGFVNGDTAAVLGGSPAYSTTATAASPVGLYPITITQGTLTAANYNFTFVNGTLSVVAAPTIVITTAATITGSATTGYTAKVTVKNTGTGPATNVVLTTATLGSAAGSVLPASLGTIAGGGGTSIVTLTFPGSTGSDGAAVAEKFAGAYTGGSFSASSRGVLP